MTFAAHFQQQTVHQNWAFNLICSNMSTNISEYLNITQIVSILTGDNNILLPVF